MERARHTLWTALFSHPLEVLVGVAIGVIGVFLSLDENQRASANLLIALGGILASVAGTRALTREAARQELGAQLDTLSAHLGTVSSQINKTIAAVQQGAVDAETALALIAQSTRTLYTLVNDIQRMTGSPFESEDLIETAQALEDMAGRFYALTSQGPAPEQEDRLAQLRDEIATLRSSLALKQQQAQPPKVLATSMCPECGRETQFPLGTAIGETAAPICEHCGARFYAHRRAAGVVLANKAALTQTVDRRQLNETVACPSCGKIAELQLGSIGGDSASPTCQQCGSMFNVHRGSDGLVFTRLHPPATTQVARITCPNCKRNEMVVKFPEGDQGERLRYCVECGARILVDIPSGRVLSSVPSDIADGTALQWAGGVSVKCPQCQAALRPFFSRDTSYFAVCTNDSRLVRAVAPVRVTSLVAANQSLASSAAGTSSVDNASRKG